MLFWKYLAPALLGLVILGVGYFVSDFCAPAATVFAVGTVIIGGFFGLLILYMMPSIPVIGSALEPAIAPIVPFFWTLLIVYAVVLVLDIVGIFVLPLGMIMGFVHMFLPILVFFILWSKFSGAFRDMTSCFGIGGAETAKIPGTGGVAIGTGGGFD